MVEIASVPAEEASALAPGQSVPEGEVQDAGTKDGQSITDAPVQNPNVPEWVPEKFRNAEDPMKAMADAYSELEKRQGKPEGSEEADNDGEIEDTEADEATVTYGPAIDAALTEAGLSAEAVNGEYEENKGLSEATYEKLANAGYPKELVDHYMAGFEASAMKAALAENDIKAIKDSVGGDQAWTTMTEWARTNLDEGKINAFNSAMDSGNRALIDMATAGLKAQYDSANGVEGRTIHGGSANPSRDVFTSPEGAADAMNEARHSGDPAKIKAVEDKMLRSNIFG